MIGTKITQFNSLDSTSNYVAKQLIAGTYTEGEVILAHFQTQGRGQRGSFWQSHPNQNLTFSFALPTEYLSIHDSFIISKAVSLAIYELISERLESHVSIKWPNDILVSDRKICGMLIESKLTENGRYTIIGIGLNVNQTQFFKGNKATSLALELGKPLAVMPVLQELIKKLNRNLDPISSGHFDDLEARYMDSLYGANQWVKFSEENRSYLGQIREVDNSGVMLVKSKQGHAKNYRTKEVEISY